MNKQEKINKSIVWGVIASESIHIFCCVLPTVFSIFSLMAGIGMIATMPGFIEEAHHLIHDYEIPMIITSGIILALGWGLYAYSRRIDCQADDGCCAKPCNTKKGNTWKFMVVATLLFTLNVFVYFALHRPHDAQSTRDHHHAIPSHQDNIDHGGDQHDH